MSSTRLSISSRAPMMQSSARTSSHISSWLWQSRSSKMVSDLSRVTNQPDMVASEVARDDPVDVAVVVVLYEGADFIADTLRSCQRYASGAPLYVVDNASTD